MISYSVEHENNNLLLFNDIIKQINGRITLLKKWMSDIERQYILNLNINKMMKSLLNLMKSTTKRSYDYCYNDSLIDNIKKLNLFNKSNKSEKHNGIKTVRDFSHDLDNKYSELINYYSTHYSLYFKPHQIVKEAFSSRQFNEEINALIQLQDGRLVLASNKNHLLIIEVSSFSYKSNLRLSGHTDFVQCVIELKDGRIASGSSDTTIKLWNCYSRQSLATLSNNENSVNNLVQLHNNNLMSTDYNNIRIWDIKTYTCITSLIDSHKEYISCILQLQNNNIVSASTVLNLWTPSWVILNQSIETFGIEKMITIAHDQFATVDGINVIRYGTQMHFNA